MSDYEKQLAELLGLAMLHTVHDIDCDLRNWYGSRKCSCGLVELQVRAKNTIYKLARRQAEREKRGEA